MEDIRQSKLWQRYLVVKKCGVVEVPSADGKHKLQAIILPLGMLGLNFLKLQRAEYDPNWQELKRIRRKNWVVSSIIEPARIEDGENYKKAGYRLSNFPYLATKTVVVDLRKTEKMLWKGLSENSKRLINKNKSAKIKEVRPEEFLEYWKKSAKIWTLKLEELEGLKQSLGKKASFRLCLVDGVCHSGLIIVESTDTANYFHTFTTDEGRFSGAHFFLVWKTILEAKRKGLSFYDFEGIYDPRWPQKKWKGFTEFKKKFGGEVITFPGCFHRWL